MRISIITPSYQQAAYLEECLRSVREQSSAFASATAGEEGVEVEHIVVDGGSTDGSKAIIERYADGLKWWCSEKDRGQSDAINKGLAHATGHAVTWVNSDDALLPGALQRVAEAFTADPELLVFGGRIVHRTTSDDRVFEALNDTSNERRLFCDPVINQPATFYRTDVVRALGGVDPALRYVMDLGLWWRFLFTHGTQHLRFDPVELALFRLHDQSKTVSAHAGFLDETASLLHAMAISAGELRMAELLASLHDLKTGHRPIAVPEERSDMVRAMIIHFVLKWHGTIHDHRQFLAMRVAVRYLENMEGGLTIWEKQRLLSLREQLKPASWLAFRLHRKLRHLRR